jgi:hypothetical protein
MDRSGTDVRGERELKLAAQAHLDKAITAGAPGDAMRWATVIDAFRYAGEDEPSIRVTDMPKVMDLRKFADAVRELEALRRKGWKLMRESDKQPGEGPTIYDKRSIPDLPPTNLDRLATLVEIRTMAPLDSAQRRALHHWVDLAVAGARSENDALDLEHRLRHLIDET